MTNPTYKNMESPVLQQSLRIDLPVSICTQFLFTTIFKKKSPQIFLYGLYT